MPFTIYTDGGSRCRHGGGEGSGAAWAFVAKTPRDGMKTFSGYLESATNNEAEYQAIIEALQWLVAMKVTTQVVIRSDSELVIKQLRGEYRVKEQKLNELWTIAYSLLDELQGIAASVQLEHIKRSSAPENVLADQLCNAEMDANAPASTTPVVENEDDMEEEEIEEEDEE